MVNQSELREARRWGNSCGVLLPREWEGKQVKVVLVDRTKEIRKEVFEILEPYLEDIMGIYLTGSYARGEQDEDSDIDIVAISGKTKKIIHSGRYNVQIYTLNGAKNTIENYPTNILSMLREAKVLLNGFLLEELLSIKVSEKNYRAYVEDSKRILNINKGYFDFDKKKGNFLRNMGVVYSSMLRLRGLYITQMLRENKGYKKENFKEWVVSEGLAEEEFDKLYEVYKNIRDNLPVRVKVHLELIEKLIKIFESSLKYGKKREET